MTATDEQKLDARIHAVKLVNELEAVLTGWVLGLDREQVERWLDPIYTVLDKDD